MAWQAFASLLDAAGRGQSDRAPAMLQRLASWGYVVEPIPGSAGFRLLLPVQGRAAS